MTIVFGIILIVLALVLIVTVLLQDSKSHSLSGTIAGGAETFFGKNKGKEINQWLPKVTTAVAIAFVILVVIMYVVQPGGNAVPGNQIVLDSPETSVETSADTAADAADTAADTTEETAA